MKSISNLIFPNKSKILIKNEIGELFVYITPITNHLDPLYFDYHEKKRLYFVCPIQLTVLELKLRIKGLIQITIERIMLFYQGTLLGDQEVSLELFRSLFVFLSDDLPVLSLSL